MEDLLLRVHVAVRTSNMKISRRCLADYVKKLQQKACRTCSTIIFPYSTNEIMFSGVVGNREFNWLNKMNKEK